MYIKNFLGQKLLFKCLFVKFCNMKEIFKEYKYLILLWIFCIIGLLFFCGHYSNILIDFGREVYYPEQILDGKVLYKDLFNIYGPLSYQFNALLYKLFGMKLSTLYFSGWFCSILAVSGIYLIAQKFLSKFLSFCIGFFTISVCVATTCIFNFHFPYSWAVLYGLIAFLYSLYFLLKFNDDKKCLNLCLSSLLAGICIANKYDFLFYAFVVLFFIFKEKNWKAFLCFISFPLISCGILFIQGMKISDLITTLQTIKIMAGTKTLTYFYQNGGIYFHPKALLTDIQLFCKVGIPFGIILYGAYLFERNKSVSIVLSIAGYFLYLWFFTINIGSTLGFLPMFLLILFLICLKKINKNLVILSLAALAASAKVFWVMLLYLYGNYYVSIVLIAILALIFNFIPKKLEKVSGVYLLIASACFLFANFYMLSIADNRIQTDKGVIYTEKTISNSSNEFIEFIKKETKPDDRIVIFPEGMTINFLTDRKSDDYYNSLIPLYIETFGEEEVIEHFKSDLPEYIVFNNQSMKDYYLQYICSDYALDFCSFIKENYYQRKLIDNGFRYLIFKRK